MEPGSKAGQLLSYSFLVVFANDGTIDQQEFKFMEQLALEDRIVDEDEKHVLKHIFERPDPQQLSPIVRAEIFAFRQKHNF